LRQYMAAGAHVVLSEFRGFIISGLCIGAGDGLVVFRQWAQGTTLPVSGWNSLPSGSKPPLWLLRAAGGCGRRRSLRFVPHLANDVSWLRGIGRSITLEVDKITWVGWVSGIRQLRVSPPRIVEEQRTVASIAI